MTTRTRLLRTLACVAAVTALGLAMPLQANASTYDTTGSSSGSLPASTRFYAPPADAGAKAQISDLKKAGDRVDAARLSDMVSTPQAVWFTGGTPHAVERDVRKTMQKAANDGTVPVLVAYNIPGRDCAQYSSGGVTDAAAYKAWISGFAAGIGTGEAIVVLEPDALGNMPGDCGVFGTADYPFTNDERYAEIGDAISALEAQPHARVYLDGSNSHWVNVGEMSKRLVTAGVQRTQGFFLNVSNYLSDSKSVLYGSWISDCIAMATDSSHWAYGHFDWCASQYYPANVEDTSTWSLTTDWYAQNMGGAVATTHFIVDTSRNGRDSITMQSYAQAPFNQPAGVISALYAGNWCNPTGAGLGVRPTADTGNALVDAYLWIKTPGQSDGQCDAAGGVRAWDYSAFTQPGWPTNAAAQAQFDPLWGRIDPAAGAWFPEQALQLAQNWNTAAN